MKERVTITMDKKTLLHIDEMRGLIPRSTFIEHHFKKSDFGEEDGQ